MAVESNQKTIINFDIDYTKKRLMNALGSGGYNQLRLDANSYDVHHYFRDTDGSKIARLSIQGISQVFEKIHNDRVLGEHVVIDSKWIGYYEQQDPEQEAYVSEEEEIETKCDKEEPNNNIMQQPEQMKEQQPSISQTGLSTSIKKEDIECGGDQTQEMDISDDNESLKKRGKTKSLDDSLGILGYKPASKKTKLETNWRTVMRDTCAQCGNVDKGGLDGNNDFFCDNCWTQWEQEQEQEQEESLMNTNV